MRGKPLKNVDYNDDEMVSDDGHIWILNNDIFTYLSWAYF
jgi:hypothetical protein